VPGWSLRDRTILITGGARGIGAATARALHARGARLALVDLDEDALEETADAIGALALTADVTDLEAMEDATARAVGELGGLDIVWSNAGIATFGPIALTEPEAFTRTVEINLLGAFRTVRAALPEVRARRGYVAFTASAATFSHAPGMGAYAATKAGVEALANALRMELSPDGVDVGTIHPIWIDTDMVREADDSVTAFSRMRESLPGPLSTTHPVSKAVDAIVRGFERRSRRVFVPEWVRVLHWSRAAIHTPLAERQIIRNVPELLALYEREAREKGLQEVVWSERIRGVLRGD
jgi:NAD(P)-dependent dehydrogenase (short-subunit alcohol dehydrogenase family)